MPYTIPIGPYHPALEEPYKLSVHCSADTVQEASIEIGVTCRAIELLVQSRLPESWAPPSHVLEVRTLGRLYVALMDERRASHSASMPSCSTRACRQ